MRNIIIIAAVLIAMSVAAAAHAEPLVIEHGEFVMTLNSDNLFLPTSIVWKGEDAELLHPGRGLDFSFTSFERRNKIYWNEEIDAWGGRVEPRFVTSGELIAHGHVARDGWSGYEVEYSSKFPFARITRRMLISDAESRIRIEYDIDPTRQIVIHETDNLNVSLRFHPDFSTKSVFDARAEEPKLLVGEGIDGPRVRRNLLYHGPTKLTNPDKGVDLLVTGTHSDNLPRPMPVQLLTLPEGESFSLITELRLAPAGDEALAAAMLDDHATVDEPNLPFLYMENASILRHNEDIDGAEQALLKAAELNQEFASPLGQLAGLRRDTKRPGQTEAWVEAGWRMPYNYGYILSGSGIVGDQRLTEEQRRLAMFNILIAMENTVFYPDYYIWGSRGFENMGMYAQAAAMYRQALWAIDHMPRPEEYKERMRERFSNRIAELEEKMQEATLTDLPELIPTRPEKE